ncbi:MAG: FliM/FliN family flagellar motor switch protein [Hydrogenothermaceae bacterium]
MDIFENLKFLYDVELDITVSIGQVEKNFGYLINLEEGDIIELNKNVEDYLDIFVEDIPLGKGELVIVNDRYSVRLIDLVK